MVLRILHSCMAAGLSVLLVSACTPARTEPMAIVAPSDPAQEMGPPEQRLAACGLTASGPITATAHGQVIENKRITSTNGAAITVTGYSDVIIRNVEIHHRGGPGILFSNSPRIRIEGVRIFHDGAPATGANASERDNNISGLNSADVVITRVATWRGSSGIYLQDCPRAQLSFIEGHDPRGPMPRGQCVQLNRCDNSVLQDFSCEACRESPCESWTEDNINIFDSAGVTLRRGRLDGNNSPTGVGVMFEQPSGQSGGLVEDVDTTRQSNGNFGAVDARNITFNRTRARDMVCGGFNRGPPSSGGLAWISYNKASGNRILASSYYRLDGQSPGGICSGGLYWDPSTLTQTDLSPMADPGFTPRAPQRLVMCFDVPQSGTTRGLYCHNNASMTNRVATAFNGAFHDSGIWSVWCGAAVDVADFTGDGLTDMYCRSGQTYWVQVNDGNSLQLGNQWLSSANFGHNCASLQPGDFNGDGRMDLLCSEGSEPYHKRVALSTGSSFIDAGIWSTWCGANVDTGDFNGDGKWDITCRYGDVVHVQTSTGSSFVGGNIWLQSANFSANCSVFKTGDFNGDGRWDLYCHENGSMNNRVALSTGGAFTDNGVWSVWCGAGVDVGDFNGDRKWDMWCRSGNTFSVQTSSDGSFGNGYVWMDDPDFGGSCDVLKPF